MRKEGFLRNFVFGVEDALVSTAGFVSGIASAAVGRRAILLSGVILIAVEAFSMAVGAFLSDESVREVRTHRRANTWPSLGGAAVMFASYLGAGFLVLAPYVFFGRTAFAVSIVVSLLALFLLGWYLGRLAHLSRWRYGMRLTLIGGAAIIIGVFVARLLPEI